MSMNIAGKVVVITGASSGLGIDVMINNAGLMPQSPLEGNSGRLIRAGRRLRHEPAGGGGRERDPVPSHAPGVVSAPA